MLPQEIFYTYLFIINLITFLVYCWDKHNAVYSKWRIPEAVLWMLAIIGGAYGASMGMLLFRHKTKHLTFQIIVPVCFILWMCVLIAMCLFA